MRHHDPVEIVTIGAGMTAAILAAQTLPASDHRMVSIEQGPAQWTYPDFAHNHDGLRYSQRYAMMHDLNRSSWTWRPNEHAPSLPMRHYGAWNYGHGLGGAMAHWSAQLWRYLPSDFRYRSYYEDVLGADGIPAGMSIQDWPLSYEDLEPYYDAFEYDIGASGLAGNIGGRPMPGGNPFEGPRARGYPTPPLAPSAFGQLFDEAARGLGLHPFPQPSGILSEGYTDPYGNVRSGCLYCGFCTRFGCEVGAKSSPLTTWLPPALDTGRYEVRTDSRVLSIETSESGLATGVRYVDRGGGEHFQPADVVVSASMAFENARNLLLARSTAHPEGIGNDNGQVGRNYCHQLFLEPVRGLWEDRRFQFFTGNTSTVSVLYDYNGDALDHSGLDFVGGAQITSEAGEREPVFSIDGLLEPFVDREWGAEWKALLASSWDSVATLHIKGEMPAHDGNFLDLDPEYTDDWGRPLLRITFDWTDNERRAYRFISRRCAEIMREMGPDRLDVTDELEDYDIETYKSTNFSGGTIMGAHPGDSVTNSYGQVWDTPNVFVTGSSLFPQNGGADPTGTAAALAYRTAEALRDRYFSQSEELLT